MKKKRICLVAGAIVVIVAGIIFLGKNGKPQDGVDGNESETNQEDLENTDIAKEDEDQEIIELDDITVIIDGPDSGEIVEDGTSTPPKKEELDETVEVIPVQPGGTEEESSQPDGTEEEPSQPDDTEEPSQPDDAVTDDDDSTGVELPFIPIE